VKRTRRWSRRLRDAGLCAILDDGLGDAGALVRMARALSRSGVSFFQLRAKNASDGEFLGLAVRLRKELAGRLFLINDRCDVALAARADGVHLGQDDLPASEARHLLGREALVGVSAGSPSELARVLRDSPDYVSLGPVYSTSTKKDAGHPLGPAGFARLIQRVPPRVPVLAVGGITPDNVCILVRAGADAVAAASCWWRAAHPGRAARDFLAIVARARGQIRTARSRAAWRHAHTNAGGE